MLVLTRKLKPRKQLVVEFSFFNNGKKKKVCTKISVPPLSPGCCSSNFYQFLIASVTKNIWVYSSKIPQDVSKTPKVISG